MELPSLLKNFQSSLLTMNPALQNNFHEQDLILPNQEQKLPFVERLTEQRKMSTLFLEQSNQLSMIFKLMDSTLQSILKTIIAGTLMIY